MKLQDLSLLELDYLMKYYHEQKLKITSRRNGGEEKYQAVCKKHLAIVAEREKRISEIKF